MNFVLIIAIILLASIVKGINGYGFALIAMPLLIIWFEPQQLVPILVISNLIASIFIVMQKKEKNLINKPYKVLIVSGSIFAFLGVIILKWVSGQTLIYLMSAFFILLSICALLGIRFKASLSALSCSVFGAIIGVITGSISISGPPLALFLHSAGVNNQKFREVFAWFSICSSVIAVAGYIIAGMITTEMLMHVLTFVPCLFIGSAIGKRLNHFLPINIFKNISLLITLVASIALLIK